MSMFYQIIPAMIFVFTVSFIVTAIWTTLVFFVSLEKYTKNYQAFLSGAENHFEPKGKAR